MTTSYGIVNYRFIVNQKTQKSTEIYIYNIKKPPLHPPHKAQMGGVGEWLTAPLLPPSSPFLPAVPSPDFPLPPASPNKELALVAGRDSDTCGCPITCSVRGWGLGSVIT